MATQRIIVHYMHEGERYAAEQAVTTQQSTDSFLMGTADDATIQKLRDDGLLVQVMEAPDRSPLRTRTRTIPPVPAAADTIDEKRPNYYLIDTDGPLFGPWRDDLEKEGVDILEYVPPSSYKALLDPAQARAVRGLMFVRALRRFGLEEPLDLPPKTRGDIPSPFGGMVEERRFDLILDDRRNAKAALDWLEAKKISVDDEIGRRIRVRVPDDKTASLQTAPGVRSVVEYFPTFDIRLHSDEGREIVAGWLQDHELIIAAMSGRKIRAIFGEQVDLVSEVAALPEVAAVDEFVPPDVRNDVARRLINIDRPPVTLTLTGANQIVGVADTGLDQTHPDFKNRIVGLIARGRPNDPSDPDGHGTHVAGSVLGDGAASGGSIRGAAPKAKLFFQSVLDAQDGLGGLPLDLHELFDEAYQAGARIHNNSWGAATRGRYTGNAVDVDDYVAKHPDMLIIIAAGNEGAESARVHSKTGYVDWLSIGSPASAKNALTVGASRSDRKDGGYSKLRWGQAWPADFTNKPIADETVSGNPECLAAFSSRGPCDDYRIKPDVVAPGTDILSTRSTTAPDQHFWQVHAPHSKKYAFMGGTSMATPITAGCAALVREYYTTKRGVANPSAALLKATLINGTRKLNGGDALADHNYTPNYHQGFGRIDMGSTVPDPFVPVPFELAFVDAGPATLLSATGDRKRYTIDVSKAGPLRICVAWTDPPGRSVQNSLALLVQHTPSKQKWPGNPQVPQSLTTPDPTNNVVVMRLDNAQPGEYLIQVSAYNLARPPQNFALVITGDIASHLTPA